jgi:hypothetical protein
MKNSTDVIVVGLQGFRRVLYFSAECHRQKKEPHRQMQLFFVCCYVADYFLAGAAGAAGAAASAAGLASSFFGAFLAFFAFFAGFAAGAFSATGGWPAGNVAGAAGSAAETTAAKETATRAATMVENTFFMVESPLGVVLLLTETKAFVVP